MAIAYEEQVGSCSARFADGGGSATRVFKVAWGDAFDFANELYGRYQTWPGGEYHAPKRFPYRNYLYCNDVAIEGLGKQSELSNADGTYISYVWAKITAQYAPMTDVDPENPEVVEEESMAVSAEMLTLPEGSYEFTADSAVVPDSAMPGRIETTTSFSVTRFHISALPDATVSGMVGKVNNAGWRGYTAGHVLFAGADARRSITTDGAQDWQLTYNFLIKDHSWNNIYRKSTGTIVAVRTVNGHDPIYIPGTFTDLGLSA